MSPARRPSSPSRRHPGSSRRIPDRLVSLSEVAAGGSVTNAVQPLRHQRKWQRAGRLRVEGPEADFPAHDPAIPAQGGPGADEAGLPFACPCTFVGLLLGFLFGFLFGSLSSGFLFFGSLFFGSLVKQQTAGSSGSISIRS